MKEDLWQIRPARMEDLNSLVDIINHGRKIQLREGNDKQWNALYPGRQDLIEDIQRGHAYLCGHRETGAPYASFAFMAGPDPNYSYIQGEWLDAHEPYWVIHRLASNEKARGVGRYCIQWALDRCNNIRIDTHEDNLTMLKLLKKLDFHRCGTIYLDNGDPRIAFQKIQNPT